MTKTSPRTRFQSTPTLAAVAILAAAGLGLFILSSCTSDSQSPVALVDTGKPAMHAVSSAQLKKAMAALNRQVGEDLRMELYTGQASSVDMTRVAQAAASMQATAQAIPNAVPSLQLDPAEKQAFLKLAAKLSDEAATLKNQATHRDQPAARATMSRIMTTCNACHTSFRLGAVSAAQ